MLDHVLDLFALLFFLLHNDVEDLLELLQRESGFHQRSVINMAEDRQSHHGIVMTPIFMDRLPVLPDSRPSFDDRPLAVNDDRPFSPHLFDGGWKEIVPVGR